MGSFRASSAHMAVMEALALMLATAVVTASLTWFLARWPQAISPTRGALAPVWREGYLAGVADERTSAAWATEYGPNRNNPYPGDEKQATNA